MDETREVTGDCRIDYAMGDSWPREPTNWLERILYNHDMRIARADERGRMKRRLRHGVPWEEINTVKHHFVCRYLGEPKRYGFIFDWHPDEVVRSLREQGRAMAFEAWSKSPDYEETLRQLESGEYVRLREEKRKLRQERQRLLDASSD